MFRDYYYELQNRLGQQAGFKQVKFRIKSKIFLLDSSTVSLCLSLFDWARYKTQKGAIKMHTLFDYDGNLPAYVNITDGKTADNKGVYDIPLLKGSVIVADRFYNDFSLLNIWDSLDYDTRPKILKSNSQIPLDTFQFSSIYTLKSFCENRPTKMA